MPSPVSVVIVSYNTREKLRRCLGCIEPEHEVIVVDNASMDGSPDMVEADFPYVRLIRNASNRGFGAANNQGMDMATRELVLLLNSDCYPSSGSIAGLAALFDDPGVVCAGGALFNPDGSPQNSAANELSLWAVFCEQTGLERLFGTYWVSRFVLERIGKPVEVAQVMGACLMLRPTERFDERYFLYCEDTDLCKRLRGHGRILYDPNHAFIHELGSSSLGPSRWLSIARYNRGKELYFVLHHGRVEAAICWMFDRLGALLRLIAYGLLAILTLGTRFRERAVMWWKVLTVRRQGPDRPPRTSE